MPRSADDARAEPSPTPLRPPLTDAELALIPRASSADPGGLSGSAKRVYAKRREFSRGRELTWALTTTLAKALGVHEDTVQRADRELSAKGYLEPTGRRRGRGIEHRLLRGNAEVYELRRDLPEQPQIAPVEPQNAAHTEGARKRESSPERRASSPSHQSAAASPSPAYAGEAAAKRKRPPKVTGWKRVRTPLGGESWVRHPEGTDRRPSAATIRELEEAERRAHLRQREHDKRVAHEASWPDRDPLAADMTRDLAERYASGAAIDVPAVGEGECQQCHGESQLVPYGSFLLCRKCAANRYAACLEPAETPAPAKPTVTDRDRLELPVALPEHETEPQATEAAA